MITASVGLFFHDSEHSYENMMFEFKWARKHLDYHGFIVSDDIGWNEAFDHFYKKYSNEFEMWNGKDPGVLRRRHAQ